MRFGYCHVRSTREIQGKRPGQRLALAPGRLSSLVPDHATCQILCQILICDASWALATAGRNDQDIQRVCHRPVPISSFHFVNESNLPCGLDLDAASTLHAGAMSIPPTTNQVQGPAIRVQGLEKSYKELHVLRGVDFDVARGSIFALLGSNGAGKTTVVKILSTLLKADAGTARVNGFDVATQAADVRESISLTGQFAAVDEILTGRENLVLVARLRHLKDPGAIADDLLRRFSLTDAGARRVATYSGGMRRRLDIAMSLIGNPPVIFLDEPTTGLDPQARIEVWQAVKELAEGGTTVLLTTQYLDEAEQLADRIAILHQGRIIVNGTLAELKQLLPPAKVEYVEKQPTLEDVFLAVVGDGETTGRRRRQGQPRPQTTRTE